MPQCRSCGAEVRWVKTENGKSMPIDKKPDSNGNIIMVEGVAKVVGPEVRSVTGNRYISHFATCPNAKAHRKD